MRTAVFGAAFRVAGFAFAGVFWGSQVQLLACHVASAQEAPQALLALLAPQTLPTLPRSLPLVLALPVLVLAPLALLAPALLTQDLGVPRFQDLSFSR